MRYSLDSGGGGRCRDPLDRLLMLLSFEMINFGLAVIMGRRQRRPSLGSTLVGGEADLEFVHFVCLSFSRSLAPLTSSAASSFSCK